MKKNYDLYMTKLKQMQENTDDIQTFATTYD
jgi:hypothetical protein